MKYKSIDIKHYKQNQNQFSEEKIDDVRDIIKKIKPSIPTYFIRPESIKVSTEWFLNNFEGKIMYSVKSNSDVEILNYLYDYGIKDFDVASLHEIELIHSLFKEKNMYFMHTIKSRESIRKAYFKYNIRDFSLDSFEELKKIFDETDNAKDLSLHIRISVSNKDSAINLSRKFGINKSNAINLLKECKKKSRKIGICFHVGSQCMNPLEYKNALILIKDIVELSKVSIDVIDIGGGFPSYYDNMIPISLNRYTTIIKDTISQLSLKKCEIWSEPGRALVSESTSLVVRVEARKNNMLYINDGIYGGLFDAGIPNFIYPIRAISISEKKLSDSSIGFGFYGPTCDGLDVMNGPFYLPQNIAEGDYIEIGQMGAYSNVIRTNFNGFNKTNKFTSKNKPLVSVF